VAGLLAELRIVTRPSALSLLVVLAATVLLGVIRAGGQTSSDSFADRENVARLLQERRYPEAIALARKLLTTAEGNSSTGLSVRVELVKTLATAYGLSGDLAAEVELLQRETRDLESKGIKDIGVAEMYQMMASPCGSLGRNFEAELSASRAVELYDAVLLPDDPRIANALLTQSIQELALGKSVEQLHALKRALKIASGSQSPLAIQTLKMTLLELAKFYEVLGDQDKAADYRARGLSISTSSLGVMGIPDDLTQAAEEGASAVTRGDFKAASVAFQRQLQIATQRFGENSPGAGLARLLLANSYLGIHEREKAKPLLLSLIEDVYQEYSHDFALMTEQERLQFAAEADKKLSVFCSYVHQFHDADPDLAGRMYDLALWSKGAVMLTARSVQERLRSTDDRELRRLREDLEENRRRYREAVASGSPGSPQLRYRMEVLEAQIVARLGLPKTERSSWQDVRSRLKPGDAAVEILRFNYTEGRSSAINYYAALILRTAWRFPRYVYLGTSSEVEDREMPQYRLFVTAKLEAPAPSLDFWNRLEDELGENTTRLFIAPDGILTNVSFVAVPDRHHTLLLDKYDIHNLSSTRDLLPYDRPSTASSAVLIGNPNFDLLTDRSEDRMRMSAALQADSPPPSQAVKPWDKLLYTGKQIDSVESILRRHGWTVHSLTEDAATKAGVLGALNGPRVLHFATHGFFAEDTGAGGSIVSARTDNAMLNSGLVLAGANSYGRGGGSGLLTSDEVTSLNLSGTELVILSACDTGLSDTLTGDEVFGLRRAFQIAGAESVMMTMWRVPEKEASEIVEEFYKNWLGGADKHAALLAAQKKVREESKPPDFWGAFVMVER
jgi:CHAT domain-containing protein